MTSSKGNKPLDRDYFKYKDRPKRYDDTDVTSCCGFDVDHKVLNVNRKEDWKQIENHIEDHLRDYKSTKSITPIVCKDCGRLLEYISIVKQDRGTLGD
jgi:ribosomal protein S15P/S13E